MEKCAAIVLAAGSGRRMQSSIPKQYLPLCGRPVLARALDAFEKAEFIGEVILVTSAEDIEYCRENILRPYAVKKVKKIVPGGAERYLSVDCGLRALKEYAPDYVFIHDGARPLVSKEILFRALEGVRSCEACVVGMPVKDTIKIADEEGFASVTPDRRYVWQIQTPQVFSYPLVRDAYERLIREGISDVTDDAMVIERMTDRKVRLIEGAYTNLKITTPEDLVLAESIINNSNEYIS